MAWEREITFKADGDKEIKALVYSGQYNPFFPDKDVTLGEVIGLFIRDPGTIELIRRKDPAILDLFHEALEVIDEFALVGWLPDTGGEGYSKEELEIVVQSRFASPQTKNKAAVYLNMSLQDGEHQPVDSPMPQPGYIYLLNGSDCYKIGLTTREVTKRVSEFAPKLPFEVEIVHTIEVDDVYAAEEHLHQRFADKRLNGEWFDLSDEDVAWIKGWGGRIG